MPEINCKICSGPVSIIHDDQYSHDYYYCKNCEYIFLDECRIIPPDREKKEYSFHENSFENQGYVNMFREFIIKAVRPYSSKIGTALDYGSGPGPVLAGLLRQEGFKTDIYDKYFSPEKVYENKKYDLITSTEVFEHLKDPLAAMNMLKNHLNGGGILAIMTLFHQNDEEHFKEWWYRRDATHISFYTPKTFEHIASLSGMKILMADKKNICVMGIE